MFSMSKGERIFRVVNIFLMLLLMAVFILPFLVVLSTSFVSAAEAARRGSFILIPEQISLNAYKIFLGKGSALWNAYGITLFRTIVGSLCSLFVTSMLAYGLSKRQLPGRNLFITMIFLTMIFSGGLVPTYIVVRSLKLTNTVWSMILPGLVSTWNFIIMKTFFSQLPESLEESAALDGAGPFTVLTRIVIPISMPVMATIGLFYAVGHWNAWFDAAMYVDRSELYPVQILMRNIVLSMTQQDINNTMIAEMGTSRPPGETIKAACIIITTLPIVCVYPFLQRYFVKGMIVGSIKE